MGKYYLVRNTYTVDCGQNSNKEMYAIAPKSVFGNETFSINRKDAYLFDETVFKMFSDKRQFNENNGYGDCVYLQEIIELKEDDELFMRKKTINFIIEQLDGFLINIVPNETTRAGIISLCEYELSKPKVELDSF